MLILNQRTEQAATDTVALGYDERKRSRLKVTLSSLPSNQPVFPCCDLCGLYFL